MVRVPILTTSNGRVRVGEEDPKLAYMRKRFGRLPIVKEHPTIVAWVATLTTKERRLLFGTLEWLWNLSPSHADMIRSVAQLSTKRKADLTAILTHLSPYYTKGCNEEEQSPFVDRQYSETADLSAKKHWGIIREVDKLYGSPGALPDESEEEYQEVVTKRKTLRKEGGGLRRREGSRKERVFEAMLSCRNGIALTDLANQFKDEFEFSKIRGSARSLVRRGRAVKKGDLYFALGN